MYSQIYLTFKDIELVMKRVSGDRWTLIYKIDQRWVKKNRSPEHISYDFPSLPLSLSRRCSPADDVLVLVPPAKNMQNFCTTMAHFYFQWLLQIRLCLVSTQWRTYGGKKSLQGRMNLFFHGMKLQRRCRSCGTSP